MMTSSSKLTRYFEGVDLNPGYAPGFHGRHMCIIPYINIFKNTAFGHVTKVPRLASMLKIKLFLYGLILL